MSQSDLASVLGIEYELSIEQSDISEIERGVRGVKDFELDAIATTLRVSPGWLLRGDDESG